MGKEEPKSIAKKITYDIQQVTAKKELVQYFKLYCIQGCHKCKSFEQEELLNRSFEQEELLLSLIALSI